MLDTLIALIISTPLAIVGLLSPSAFPDESVVVAIAPIEEITESIEVVENVALLNSSSCGTAAKNYSYTDTNFSGTMCSSGDGSPNDPLFPVQGGGTSWMCRNGANDSTPPWPECPFKAQANRTIVNLKWEGNPQTIYPASGEGRVLSWTKNGDESETQLESISLPAGTYTVHLASWERMWSVSSDVQIHEQWEAVLLNGTTEIGVTAMIDDVPDSVFVANENEERFLHQTLSTPLVLAVPATKVFGRHPFYPIASTAGEDANSIKTICVAFDDISNPTPPVADSWCSATRDDTPTVDLEEEIPVVSSSTIARGNDITL